MNVWYAKDNTLHPKLEKKFTATNSFTRKKFIAINLYIIKQWRAHIMHLNHDKENKDGSKPKWSRVFKKG